MNMNKKQLDVSVKALKYLTSDIDDQIHTRPYSCTDKECFDRGNFHVSCVECKNYTKEDKQNEAD